MKPKLLGRKYDRIAAWWHERHNHSDYGVAQVTRALRFRDDAGAALDIGCGSGGRIVRILQNRGYDITGVDVSEQMIALATTNHPKETFIQHDICEWNTHRRFDVIVAWDSLFHLPFDSQREVISKLCEWLDDDGVLIYSFGNATGEHTDTWHDDTFYYSSIGIDENIRVLMQNGLCVVHLELDQLPDNHAFVIARKLKSGARC